MFGLFKETEEDKEKRLAKLQAEADRLNHSHSHLINRFLYVPGGRFNDDWLAVFKGFYVKDDDVHVAFVDKETKPGHIKFWMWGMLRVANDADVIEYWHNRYNKLKNQFNLFGVELKVKETDE